MKPLVSDPDMHHGTCVTHVPWCVSKSLTRFGGEHVPGIPGACNPQFYLPDKKPIAGTRCSADTRSNGNLYQLQDDENPLVLLKELHEKITKYKSHVLEKTLYQSGELVEVEKTVTCTEGRLKGIGVFLSSLLQAMVIVIDDMCCMTRTLKLRKKQFEDSVASKAFTDKPEIKTPRINVV